VAGAGATTTTAQLEVGDGVPRTAVVEAAESGPWAILQAAVRGRSGLKRVWHLCEAKSGRRCWPLSAPIGHRCRPNRWWRPPTGKLE
jgi:hypothetical protein